MSRLARSIQARAGRELAGLIRQSLNGWRTNFPSVPQPALTGTPLSEDVTQEAARLPDDRLHFQSFVNDSDQPIQMLEEPTHKFLQGLFNGKPKATFPLSFDETVVFGLPLNEFMRPL